MRSLLPALVLLLPIALFAADAPLSTIHVGPAVGTQTEPAIAVNGGAAFVIWTDYRARDLGVPPLLLGSRVDALGTLLDPRGIVISDGSRGHIGTYFNASRLRADGDGFLATWEEGGRRFQRRIAADGTLLSDVEEASPAPRVNHPDLRGDMRSATDGETVLWVARPTLADASSLYIVRTTTSGEILNGPTLYTGARGGIVAFLWNGQEYVLVVTAGARTYAVRFDREGNPIGPAVELVLTNNTSHIRTATHGDGSMAVIYTTSNPAWDIEAVVIRDGQVIHRAVLAGEAALEQTPSIAATNGGYLAAWHSGNGDLTNTGIHVRLLRRDLTPALPEESPIEETESVTEQRLPNAARDSVARLFVWHEQDGLGISRIMYRVAEPGPQSRFVIWTHGPAQYAPAVAAIGPTHLVVWYEGGGQAPMRLRALRVDASGLPLDPEPLTIGTANWRETDEFTNAAAPPSVVWSGRYFLIGYVRGAEVRLARVTAGGVLISDEAIAPALRQPQNKPVLVRAGRTTFAVWQEGEANFDCIILCIPPTPGIIRGTRFSETGERLDPIPFDIATEDFSIAPDAAWDGYSLIVTWTRDERVFAQTFDHHGIPYTRYDLGVGSRPAVAARNNHFLLTWERGGNIVGVEELYRVPFLVGEATGDKQRPRPFLTEDDFGVLFERRPKEWPVLGVSRVWSTVAEPPL